MQNEEDIERGSNVAFVVIMIALLLVMGLVLFFLANAMGVMEDKDTTTYTMECPA